ncbi:hypothetical protein [Halalkalicoccus salilacus]|uniref:hypothetical protein n=1 Tax=Halalkalicoccus salilacus TaxID=3117459 RepID=UPI00300F773F
MNSEDGEPIRLNDMTKIASLERKIILIATIGTLLGGLFLGVQPLDLTIWDYDNGNGLIPLSFAILIFLFVWVEWRKITAGIAVFIAGFLLLVAVVNLTSDPGLGIILTALSSLVIGTAALSAFWKFRRITE